MLLVLAADSVDRGKGGSGYGKEVTGVARNDGRRAVGPASGRLRSGVSGQSGGSLACGFRCQTELRGMALRRAKVFCDELRMRKRCWRLSAPSP